jgi:uncharacterized iron-regulated membrane protein
MRRLVFNLHLYVSLIVAVFALVLALTGSIMAFEPELDHLFHWRLSYATALPRSLSLAEIGAAAAKVFPGEPVRAYEFSTSPDLSYQVRFRGGIVFVNPYTGVILGTQTDPDGASIFLRTVHRIHVSLLPSSSSEVGGNILSWASVGVGFLVFSGLYLWWPLKRVRVSRRTGGRRFWRDLHHATGIVSMPLILALVLTGMVIGFNETAASLLFQITGFHPPAASSVPPTVLANRPISPDEAIDIARAALPGAAPFDLNVPAPRGNYQIRMRYPEDRTPGGRSHVVVDQYSGKVLVAQSSRTAPAATRVLNANRAIHTGDVFGLPSKVVMALACLTLVVQVLSGGMMWWKRRGKARRSVSLREGERS